LSDESAHERRGSDANAPEAAATRRKFRRVVRTLFLSLKKPQDKNKAQEKTTAKVKTSPTLQNERGAPSGQLYIVRYKTYRRHEERILENESADINAVTASMSGASGRSLVSLGDFWRIAL
jgi:hypothetical protein